MAMWNMCDGILGFYSVRQFFFWSDNFSKLLDRMSDKLSWILDMSANVSKIHFHYKQCQKSVR
jgi:hypothetical protein